MDIDQVAASASERAAIYEFLSIALGEEIPLAFLEALRAEPPELDEEWDRVCAQIAEADDVALEAIRSELAAEYVRVFLGMSKNPIAPYESVYTSPAHLLMQEARDEVVALYRREGFAIDAEEHLPEDHLAFELGFMAGLCRRTAEACEAGRPEEAERLLEAQRRFVGSHLQNWVPQFVGDMRERVNTPFYAALASLLDEFVAAEAEWLEEDVPQ